MTETNITLAADSALAPPQEPQIYRPMSMLAIAGLALAGLYVALVVLVSALGFFQATPVFLPGWTLLVPIAAASLCLLGLWQIHESEGTRAGQALARWGLVISIFSFGYPAYQYFTRLALVQQANEFLMVRSDDDSGFFPLLQSGDPVAFRRAFLLTMPESDRAGIDPKKHLRKMEQMFNRGRKGSEGGPLSMFLDNSLIRSITRHGSEANVEPLGVQKWLFEKGGYVVWRNYRVSLPEMVVDLLLPVQSTEGDQRKWFVGFRKLDVKRMEWTALGAGLLKASFDARTFVDRTAAQTPWKELTDVTRWSNVISDRPWEPIRDHIATCFRAGGENHNLQASPPKMPGRELPSWSLANQRLRFRLDFEYKFKGPSDMPWMGNGVVVVEDQNPLVLDAKGRPDPQSLGHTPAWKIVSLEFRQLSSMMAMMGKTMEMPR